MAQVIEIELKKSLIGKPHQQCTALTALGLKKIGRVVVLQDTPGVRGLVRKVQHLVNVKVREI